jgi:hypothetical protein
MTPHREDFESQHLTEGIKEKQRKNGKHKNIMYKSVRH